MSDVWRILVAEGDENLNRNIANTLRNDGYVVQSVLNGADAVRVLWSEEFVAVICNVKIPGAGGFELLQWLRAYRPNTRMLLLGDANSPLTRMQALEGGADSYLEKPVDFRVLKEDLRRLLQQPGFSADLDSFDLLDVIQMVTMSHRSIALLVNAGLEERGLLRLQNGELIWAEYGTLRGEEAFFALAAHKNGSVVQQPWSETFPITPNVKQPLSRLIFHALQYRTKYENATLQQQQSGEYEIDSFMSSALEEVDDSPFVMSPVLDDSPFSVAPEPAAAQAVFMPGAQDVVAQDANASREWWERTGSIPVPNEQAADNLPMPETSDVTIAMDRHALANGQMGTITPSSMHKTAASQRVELPTWLMDQSTSEDGPKMRSSARIPATPPPAPAARSSSPEWQASLSAIKAAEQASSKQSVVPPSARVTDAGVRQSSSAEWQTPEWLAHLPTSDVPPQPQPRKTDESVAPTPWQENERELQQITQQGHNYPALVSALQTLGYSIFGFVAAAVVSMDGQPVAQVAIDDLDISWAGKPLSALLQGICQTLEHGAWGECEDTVISTAKRRILIRNLGDEKKAFQVLITTREANPEQSLEVMRNVEGAISAALR